MMITIARVGVLPPGHVSFNRVGHSSGPYVAVSKSLLNIFLWRIQALGLYNKVKFNKCYIEGS